MAPSTTAVAINALMRRSSVFITSCVNARWKSSDTPVSWSFFLSENPGIIAPCDDAVITSIERAAEACIRDRHCHQHQYNQCNRVVLQVKRHNTKQQDGADDADVMRQRQHLAE